MRPSEMFEPSVTEQLSEPFDNSLIKQRQGGGGMTFSYVSQHEYIKKLNDTFGIDWSFTIVDYKVFENQIVVHARITVGDMHKDAFGSAQIKTNRHNGEPLSIGDDFKGAASDAMKKAASLLGVGIHLYDKGPSDRPAASSNKSITAGQIKFINGLGSSQNISSDEMFALIKEETGKKVSSIKELTSADASKIIETLKNA